MRKSNNVCIGLKPICHNETKTIIETTYPFKKIEEGVSLDLKVDVLRQAVYELKIENQRIKDCAKLEDYKLYSECVNK
jgi:hypothetical protein